MDCTQVVSRDLPFLPTRCHQVMDLKSEGQPDVGMETLTWIHTHKTAALLKAAVASGAILAGASDEVRCAPFEQWQML